MREERHQTTVGRVMVGTSACTSLDDLRRGLRSCGRVMVPYDGRSSLANVNKCQGGNSAGGMFVVGQAMHVRSVVVER
jgi:hypothetical protein